MPARNDDVGGSNVSIPCYLSRKNKVPMYVYMEVRGQRELQAFPFYKLSKALRQSARAPSKTKKCTGIAPLELSNAY